MRHALTPRLRNERGAGRVPDGAPLRLRCENELGFKMVKWIEAIGSCTTLRILVPGGAGQRRPRNLRLPNADLDSSEPLLGERSLQNLHPIVTLNLHPRGSEWLNAAGLIGEHETGMARSRITSKSWSSTLYN